MIGLTLFDWPFFILLFGIGLLKFCAQIVNFASPLDLPGWTSSAAGQLVLALVFLPLAYMDYILWIYGFLILPWYTVLICLAAETIVGGAFHGLIFQPLTRRFGPFAAFLVALLVAAMVAGWYFGYAHELRTFTLSVGGCIGIAAVILYFIVNAIRWLRTPKLSRDYSARSQMEFWKRPRTP